MRGAFFALLALSLVWGTHAHQPSTGEEWLSSPDSELKEPEACRVQSVVSGNTLIVVREGKPVVIQLEGVAAPAYFSPTEQTQYYGRECSEALRNMLLGEQVILSRVSKQADANGHVVAQVHRWPDRLWINSELIRQGYARKASVGAAEISRSLAESERSAKDSHKGLWNEPFRDAWKKSNRADAGQSEVPIAEEPGVILTVCTAAGVRGGLFHLAECPYCPVKRTVWSLSDAQQRGKPCGHCLPTR